MRIKIYKYISLIALLFLPIVLFSQNEHHSPAAYEKMKMNWLWDKTSNAAGLKLDEVQDFSLVDAGYNMESGDFHRVMNGEKKNSLKLNTEGGIHIKDIYFWGKFNYTRNAIKDAKFNTSILDPYRGMPYAVADTNLSNWNNQHYELDFKINFPQISEKLHLGVDGEYHASIGAKQRDIRSENYYMLLSIRPGMVFSINENNHLGANFEYSSNKEQSSNSNVNTYVDQPYYELHGLGNATIGIGNGRSTNYIGNKIGGGLQYNLNTGGLNLLLSSNYSLKVEDANISFTNPRKAGTIVQHQWLHKIQMAASGNSYSHYIQADLAQSKSKGIEYINEYDDSGSMQGYVTLAKSVRSTYSNLQASLAYDITKNRDNEYSWLLGTKLSYTELDDLYLLPKSESTGKNLYAELHGKYNFKLSDNLSKRLLVGLKAVNGSNLNGHYIYNGAFAEYPVTDNLVGQDNQYFNSNFLLTEISATYSQQAGSKNDLQLYVKAAVSHTSASSYDYKNRQLLSFNLGFNF